MMKRRAIGWMLLVVSSGWISVTPAMGQAVLAIQDDLPTSIAQALNEPELNRAKNLARQAAEQANGGITRYRAEDSMQGPASESSYTDNGDGTVTFTFVGGTPNATPSLETVATVNLATGAVSLDYNGSIRQ